MSNPWIIFQDLIASTRRTIAKVISTSGTTGRVQVLQTGESTNIYVESNGSTYANDSYVYIEDGVIVGQAPNLRSSVTELLS